MTSELASFELPKIFDNPAGWGPGQSVGSFDDPLFQPYNKSERLTKISDWTIINRSKGTSLSHPIPTTLSLRNILSPLLESIAHSLGLCRPFSYHLSSISRFNVLITVR